MELKYLAYGANMDAEMMKCRCPDAKFLGTGVLKDWRLMFKGKPPSSYGTIEEWEGFSVPYVLWEISAADERNLNHYEGYPKHYLKGTVAVEFNGETVWAMYYFKPEDQPVGAPCDHYVAVLWGAYEKFGFDLSILIRARDFSCGDSL